MIEMYINQGCIGSLNNSIEIKMFLRSYSSSVVFPGVSSALLSNSSFMPSDEASSKESPFNALSSPSSSFSGNSRFKNDSSRISLNFHENRKQIQT